MAMRLTLRPNEKIYINGAVLRVDRKVSVELMNDAVFLLEAHVMLEADATTPLRRLYFVVQLMLMEPNDRAGKLRLFAERQAAALASLPDTSIRMGMDGVGSLVAAGRVFDALKVIRNMLPLEAALLGPAAPDSRSPVVADPAPRAAA